MSIARAEFYRLDGSLFAHGVYDATVDILQPFMLPSIEAARDLPDWRTAWDERARCITAAHGTEECLALADYGAGHYWTIRYCPTCMLARGPMEPLDDANAYREWQKNRGRPRRTAS